MAIEAKEIQLKDIDIHTVVRNINEGTKTKDMAIQLDIPLRIMKEKIKEGGYKWLGSKYVLESEIKKKESNDKVIEEKVKVTYRINKELQRLVKLQSIIEDTDNSTIIEKAINSYISEETKATLKKL
ncbi:hypothetical protein V4R14_04970 [Listeria monocytogenes]